MKILTIVILCLAVIPICMLAFKGFATWRVEVAQRLEKEREDQRAAQCAAEKRDRERQLLEIMRSPKFTSLERSVDHLWDRQRDNSDRMDDIRTILREVQGELRDIRKTLAPYA